MKKLRTFVFAVLLLGLACSMLVDAPAASFVILAGAASVGLERGAA